MKLLEAECHIPLSTIFGDAPFPAPQEEYRAEQIQWYPMPLLDFHSCVDLISARPHGILRILDDQTCLPQVPERIEP